MHFLDNTQPYTRGLFINSGSAIITEIAASQGFDWLLLDLEHGSGDCTSTLQQITALSNYPVTPIVRIPQLGSDVIKRVLDCGAGGIMAPMISSGEEAKTLVKAIHYPPIGCRGLSKSCRASDFGTNFNNYYQNAKTSMLAIAQIENKAGVDNVDEIAAVPGIDILFIGHSDLTLSLGHDGDFYHPDILAAEAKVFAAAKKYDKIMGILLRPNISLQQAVDKGYRFIACGGDLSLAKAAFKRVLEN